MRTVASLSVLFLTLVSAITLATAGSAQCTTSWSTEGTWDAPPKGFASLANGDLVAFGAFTIANGVPCRHVARHDGSSWTAIGPGIANDVVSLAELPNGDLVAAQDSSTSLWRWDGSAWSPYAAPFVSWLGVAGQPKRLAVAANGDVCAAFDVWWSLQGGLPQRYRAVARWDGTVWHPAFGSPLVDVSVTAMRASPLGVHYVVEYGTLTTLMEIWPTQTQVAQFVGTVAALEEHVDGDLVAIGNFSSIQPSQGAATLAIGVARWDGTTWTQVGSGIPSASAVASLPDGDLCVASRVAVAQDDIWRFDGTGWIQLGSADGRVDAMAFQATGALAVSGHITSIAGVPVGGVARYATNCPADVATFANGCANSAGFPAWTVHTAPWIGGTYRATCDTLPADCFVAEAFGFGVDPHPMAMLFPQGLPGCVVQPTLDGIGLRIPQNGSLRTEVPVPDLPIAGLRMYHQLAPFEVDAMGNLLAVTVTDTLRLTLGSF